MKHADIDWRGGRVVHWNLDDFRADLPLDGQVAQLKEDLVQVVFPGETMLDVGWYPSFSQTGDFLVQLVQDGDWDAPVWSAQGRTVEALRELMVEATAIASGKIPFMQQYEFPLQWLASGLYPDDLFCQQKRACEIDPDPTPKEHVRYGAFLWWLRAPASLSQERLKMLCQLAVADPDCAMSGAAMHDILSHPRATEEIAEFAANLATDQPGWRQWHVNGNPLMPFTKILEEARRQRFLISVEARITGDLKQGRLSERELRDMFDMHQRRVWKSLVLHPGLPVDILEIMSTTREGQFARQIRSAACQRLKKKG